MNATTKVPSVPLQSFKRTKIIATIGPATDNYESVYELINNGVNGIRLNFSHGTQEEHAARIPWVRHASAKIGKPIAVIQDLQGPKIRLGDFDGVIPVRTGQELILAYGVEYVEGGPIPIQYDLSKKMKVGERLYIFDGKVRTEVTALADRAVHVTVKNDGILIKRKGINVPDTDFGGDILTKKDLSDIAFGATQDMDYVAMSFVQSSDDIHRLRKLLKQHGSKAKIIVKFETKAAVQDIEGIVKATDVVMIARGDLAVETSPESVPVVQREIIRLGQKYVKPTIVATQMLLSMVDMPEPTRAEVSDVATAVFLGADCVMLSDETAMGKYPVDTVKTMKRVLMYAEQSPLLKTVYNHDRDQTMGNAISNSVISMANGIAAQAIVAETSSGATARQISARRPDIPVIAVTDVRHTAQQLAIVYGIKSYMRPAQPNAAQKLTDWMRENKVLQAGDVVVTVSGRYPGKVGTTDTIKVRVLE
ncbi:MAG TPA: pyruvate kinase [Candidatus Saccharimonadales bacterium]|nr:pyruvate kinase [Candidatus Saccharimonadales bacterium]